jgi:hypothetical protein
MGADEGIDEMQRKHFLRPLLEMETNDFGPYAAKSP